RHRRAPGPESRLLVAAGCWAGGRIDLAEAGPDQGGQRLQSLPALGARGLQDEGVVLAGVEEGQLIEAGQARPSLGLALVPGPDPGVEAGRLPDQLARGAGVQARRV